MGKFSEGKLMKSLLGVYLRLNLATSEIEKKKFSCAKQEKNACQQMRMMKFSYKGKNKKALTNREGGTTM